MGEERKPHIACQPQDRPDATNRVLGLCRRVPRYTFTIHDGGPDTEPVELDFPHLNAARAEAIRAAGEMLREIDGSFSGHEWRMEVKDDAGKRLLTLRFRAEENA